MAWPVAGTGRGLAPLCAPMTNSDDFFDRERHVARLYEDGRQIFLRGRHEEAIEHFKRLYVELVSFRDVEEIVADYYTKPRGEWIAKYQERFESGGEVG
jgi:hypothetical protein